MKHEEKKEIKFQYLTEANLQKMEEEQSQALYIIALVGILMMISATL